MIRGNSGCILEIIETESIRVRKISYDFFYNKRLEKQMVLQSLFIDKAIFTPKIVGYGYIGDKYYFDMDYINGNSFINWLEFADLDSIKTNILSIYNQVSNSDLLKPSYLYDDLIENKIQNKYLSLLEVNNDVDFNRLIKAIGKEILDFDFNLLPITACHGDLTLENIIISESNKIYYIDFLDSFIDSWLIDIAKLLQDSLLLWSLRYDLNNLSTNYRLRLYSLSQLILSRIYSEYDQYYIDVIYRLLLINILRIIPYCKDIVTKKWIIDSSDKVLEIIKGEK